MVMVNIIQDHLLSSFSMNVDDYSFLTDTAAKDFNLNIVWWNYDQKALTLVEPIVSLETSYEAAIMRKEDWYHDLIAEMRKTG